MALNSLRLLEDCDIVAAHVFPFSPRPDTPAARMPQVAREVVKARAARLRDAAAQRRRRWLDSLSRTVQPILVEGDGVGHTDNFAPVAIAVPLFLFFMFEIWFLVPLPKGPIETALGY